MLELAAEHLLDEEQCRTFRQQGYLVLPGVLGPDEVEDLVQACQELEQGARARGLEGPEFFDHGEIDTYDAFFDLMDHPKTFPAVWSALGWNIRLYTWHITVNRRDPAPESPDGLPIANWHFDGARMSIDPLVHPRPRLSVKIGFYLTDLTELGNGNLYVIPGSHLRSDYSEPDALGDRRPVMPGLDQARPVFTRSGDAVLLDRRVWHGIGANLTDNLRIALHYGYSIRWMQSKSDLGVGEDRYAAADPIRRQLLGANTGQNGWYAPADGDVPLRRWLEARGVRVIRAAD